MSNVTFTASISSCLRQEGWGWDRRKSVGVDIELGNQAS